MKSWMLILIWLLSVGTMSPVFALVKPTALATDNRIKVVAFEPNQVYPINGSTLITTQIVFGKTEQIVDVEGGDAAAWTLTIDKVLPNVLNLKPTITGSHSNLTVVTIDTTAKRRFYRFSLKSQTTKTTAQQTYALQFVYPNAEKAALLAKLRAKQARKKIVISPFQKPEAYNWAYTFSGARSIMPLHVFDDGKFTYFQLQPNQVIPAVFAVNNSKGRESVVNYRRVGNYLVIEDIAPQFTLRAGKTQVASIFNQRLIQQLMSRG